LPVTNTQNLRHDVRATSLFRNHETEPEVPAVKTATYLGLVLDDDLTFNQHRSSIVLPKMKAVNSLVRSIRNKISLSTAKLLYNSLFLPSHDYASAVYDTTGRGTGASNEALEVANRRMLRTVHHYLPWETSNQTLYQTSETTILQNRRKNFVANIAHSCFHQKGPTLLHNKIATGISEGRAILPRVYRTDMFKNSFEYRARLLWNKIPHEIRMIEETQRFKSRVNDWTLHYGAGAD
jgi:hypothetical protein